MKIKYNSFWIVSILTLFGYFGKYGISIYFSYLKKKNDKRYFKNYNTTDFNNNTDNNITMNFIDFLFSSNTATITPQGNDTYKDIIYEYDKNLYLYICATYFVFILLSIGLYSLFKYCVVSKKEEKNIINENNEINDANNIEPKANKTSKSCSDKCLDCFCVHKLFFELCNCLFYIESFVIENNNKKRVGCCTLCVESIKQYCNDALCNLLNNEENRINCCPCCNNYNEDDYEKTIQFFCYCYKEEGFFSWVNEFFINDTQKEIIPCLIIYFIYNLMIIGSERIYEDKL